MIALRACGFEETTALIVRLALDHALRQTPRRLALWRIRTMDHFLRQLEDLRLEGERSLPDDFREDLLAFATRHDRGLLGALAGDTPADLNTVQDALFEAQGRVMVSLAALRRLPCNLAA